MTRLTTRELTNQMRDMILRGSFASGEHLRETALAEQFAVSRTPIRAALAANAKDGLLEYSPNRGYMVRTFDVRDIADAYEMRAVLEGTACRIAAERGLKLDAERDARRAIDTVDALFRESGSLGEVALDTWRQQNLVFHEAILGQANNRFLKDMLQMVRQIPSVYPPVLAPYKMDELRFYNAEHRRILECIIDRQGSRAEYLMREHVYHAGETIVASVRAHEPRARDAAARPAENAEMRSERK
jgi:GntR family transcriptional regulator, vanillate catabolism transcriptional regulator